MEGDEMKKDNRGISLVEIIIVIAIMTVVGGAMFYGVGMISGKPAQKCAQKIVFSLDRHRTTAMGKMDSSYTLRVDGDQIVLDEYIKTSATESSNTTVPVGSSGVTVKYTCGGTEKDLASESLVLGFERGSGAFRKQADGTYCTEIKVSKAGTEYIIDLVPLTGKVSIRK